MEKQNKILEKIKTDNLQARKDKNKVIASLLTTLVSEIEMVGKNSQRETTETETIKVIEKFTKNVISTIELVSATEALTAELKLYQQYLPEKLSKEELTKIILDIIKNDSNINIGKIMGQLKKGHNGTYDGKLASEIIKEVI
jgi:hypothetical protein